jgi:hypothetical protein
MRKQKYDCKVCLWSDLGHLKNNPIKCVYNVYINNGKERKVKEIPPKWCPLKKADAKTKNHGGKKLCH